MALLASLKNLIRRQKKKKNSSKAASSSSSSSPSSPTSPTSPVSHTSTKHTFRSLQSQDSGTALTTASSSPPSRHSKAQSCSVHTPSRSHSYSPSSTKAFSMARSSPSSRSASPCITALSGKEINPCSNEVSVDPSSTDDAFSVSSVQHFSAQPAAQMETHNLPQQHRDDAAKSHITAGNNNKNLGGHAETASRMIAEANQQKNTLPTYHGLERFTLLEKMGDGAFSSVFKAYDTKNARVVAVKVVRKVEMNAHQNVKHLHRDMKKKPRVTERANILKEVQIMRQLKHPGIVELYDFFESDEFYFLILEIAAGGELFHRIVHLTYFSEDLARHVIVQVAQAIRYLHEERGVVHRDIKPENILFEPIPIIPSPGYTRDEENKEDEGVFIPGIGGGGIGRVKIADFGLSKIVWDEQTMTPCGTVGYTAPEIVKDERYSKSVDMWALGCVLYTLLVGFPPFYDESIQALTEKVARGQYTFLSPWWDEISLEVKDLISHLLCVNPDERYTIDEFLAHPWIQAGEQPMTSSTDDIQSLTAPEISIATPENKILANVAAMTPDYGAPRTPRTPHKRRAENPLSPGVGLREVFDVSNAVHRMGEESRRRHTPQGTGYQVDNHNRQRQAFMAQLNEEDEDDEDEHGYQSGSMSSMSEDEAIAEGIRNVQVDGPLRTQDAGRLYQQQKEYQLAQEQIAAKNHHKYLQQQQQAGVPIPDQTAALSLSSRLHAQQQPQQKPQQKPQAQVAGLFSGGKTMASGTTASSGSGTRRRRGGFELKMDQATLLKRRARQQEMQPHLGQTVERQDQLRGQTSPALVV
ncbi:MAG: CAMK/CAMK1 protein kinase [Benniella sp.]|nr:MAG: CAMK/CAMK1 protein kinase [Benniella sp.]